jgi:uncharacterized protein
MVIPGLSEEATRKIIEVCSFFPELDRVVLYGSRAKGSQKAVSDIDFAIWGAASPEGLALALDELPLPWTFDVRSYESIRNPALRDHIDRVGVVIWRKE